jgi:hypothetical protein
LAVDFECHASKAPIDDWIVILSEAYFSGAEGSAFALRKLRNGFSTQTLASNNDLSGPKLFSESLQIIIPLGSNMDFVVKR